MCGQRLKLWNTMPMDVLSARSSRAEGPRPPPAAKSTVRPSNVTLPASGFSKTLMQRRNVLLPDPLAPMTVTTSPGRTSTDTPFSTSWPPKLLRSPAILISGSSALMQTPRAQGFPACSPAACGRDR